MTVSSTSENSKPLPTKKTEAVVSGYFHAPRHYPSPFLRLTSVPEHSQKRSLERALVFPGDSMLWWQPKPPVVLRYKRFAVFSPLSAIGAADVRKPSCRPPHYMRRPRAQIGSSAPAIRFEILWVAAAFRVLAPFAARCSGGRQMPRQQYLQQMCCWLQTSSRRFSFT